MASFLQQQRASKGGKNSGKGKAARKEEKGSRAVPITMHAMNWSALMYPRVAEDMLPAFTRADSSNTPYDQLAGKAFVPLGRVPLRCPLTSQEEEG